MAIIKRKTQTETPQEVKETVQENREQSEIQDTTKEEHKESKYLTDEEKEALQKQNQQEKEQGASTKKLEKATMVVSSMFNLGEDYKVTSFNDKGKSVKLVLDNSDFKLDIEIKHPERAGLVFED